MSECERESERESERERERENINQKHGLCNSADLETAGWRPHTRRNHGSAVAGMLGIEMGTQ